jgi:hypothetical protein
MGRVPTVGALPIYTQTGGFSKNYLFDQLEGNQCFAICVSNLTLKALNRARPPPENEESERRP